MFIIVDIILQCRNCFPKISGFNWSVLHMVYEITVKMQQYTMKCLLGGPEVSTSLWFWLG